MKKLYRLSQMQDIIGRHIYGNEMHMYGLPYDGAVGFIMASNSDLVELMLAAVERHPELHVVTTFEGGRSVNRYVAKGTNRYYLHFGNADPDLEFDGWSRDDIPEEEQKAFVQFLKDFYNSNWNIKQTAAVNWAIQNIKKHAAKDSDGENNT